jgi:hypothetical protein
VNPEVRAGYTVGWLEGARRRLLLSTPVFSQQWPETLEIREAHLEIACYEAIDCQDAPLELYRLKRAWAPLGCTWHRADASGNQRWQTDGAGGSQDRGASCEDATRITARFERGDGLLWVRWDITDVAREWVAGAPNHGLLLESSGAEQSGEAWPDANYFARFHPTHDSDHNSNPQLRPRLVILVERR